MASSQFEHIWLTETTEKLEIVDDEYSDKEYSDGELQQLEPDATSDKSDSSGDERDDGGDDGTHPLHYLGKDGQTTWKCSAPATNPEPREEKVIVAGVKPAAQCFQTPIECWQLFFTEELISNIVIYTNTLLQKRRLNYRRDRDCPDTTVEEVKALFGLLYLAGAMKSSHASLKELWDTDGTTPEYFRAVMTYNRIYKLIGALRFENILESNERKLIDKLAPVRQVLETFNKQCFDVYAVGECVTIDRIVEARGRCSFKQVNKSSKCGLMMNTLFDARSWYTAKIEIFCRDQPPGPYQQDNSRASIAKRLIQPFSNSGRNLTIDSSFCTVSLVDELLLNYKTTVVGMLKKKSPEVPHKFVIIKNRLVNDSLYGFRENSILLSHIYRKNKNSILVTSLHNANALMEAERTSKKNEVYEFYNLTKSWVEKFTAMKEEFSVARVTSRWPLTVLYALMDIAGINSQIVFRENSNIIKSRRDYLKTLAKELTKPFLVKRSAVVTIPMSLRLAIRRYAAMPDDDHLQFNSTDTSLKREHDDDALDDGIARMKCFYCPRRKNRKTKSKCGDCSVPICKQHTVNVCVKCRLPTVKTEVTESVDE